MTKRADFSFPSSSCMNMMPLMSLISGADIMDTLLYTMSTFDKQLGEFLASYGLYIYALLFLLIYLKTAFIVLTFIPGDSLVFASGALAAVGSLNGEILAIVFFLATICGDNQNFSIGRIIKGWNNKRLRPFLLKETQIRRAEQFMNRYGKISIITARFIPLMRTTVPVACALMNYSYRSFFKHNTIGAILWVCFWLSAGLMLGQIPIVEEHLVGSLLTLSLIPFSVPVVFFFVKRIANS